jgi:hypothetical protein
MGEAISKSTQPLGSETVLGAPFDITLLHTQSDKEKLNEHTKSLCCGKTYMCSKGEKSCY